MKSICAVKGLGSGCVFEDHGESAPSSVVLQHHWQSLPRHGCTVWQLLGGHQQSTRPLGVWNLGTILALLSSNRGTRTDKLLPYNLQMRFCRIGSHFFFLPGIDPSGRRHAVSHQWPAAPEGIARPRLSQPSSLQTKRASSVWCKANFVCSWSYQLVSVSDRLPVEVFLIDTLSNFVSPGDWRLPPELSGWAGTGERFLCCTILGPRHRLGDTKLPWAAESPADLKDFTMMTAIEPITGQTPGGHVHPNSCCRYLKNYDEFEKQNAWLRFVPLL